MINNRSLQSESSMIEELKIIFENQKGWIGIGDDAALIDHNMLISTDAMVEGVHFIREKSSWQEVSYKLFASNASDIAAMGGYVIGYTLTLSLPKYWMDSDFRSFLTGIRLFLKHFPATLVGGDLVRSNEFFASVTVFGKTNSIPWLRTKAKEGDFIYCTGTLGDSKLWLNNILDQKNLPLYNEEYFRKRHYYPCPRLNWVSALKRYAISSAIDISDGLVEDLQKLCKASNKSFFIDSATLPLSVEQIGQNNVLEHKIYYQKEALIGGEDYELLFTSSEILDIEALYQENIKITRIGRILSNKEQSFILYNGMRREPSEFKGFQH